MSIQYYLFDYSQKKFHEIHDGFSVGRADATLVFESDSLLSRKHCVFRLQGQTLFLEDLSSTNGTSVNSVRLESAKGRKIQVNDLIECGKRKFTVTTQQVHAPAAPGAGMTVPGVLAIKKKEGGFTIHFLTEEMISQTKVLVKKSEVVAQSADRLMKKITAHSIFPEVLLFFICAFHIYMSVRTFKNSGTTSDLAPHSIWFFLLLSLILWALPYYFGVLTLRKYIPLFPHQRVRIFSVVAVLVFIFSCLMSSVFSWNDRIEENRVTFFCMTQYDAKACVKIAFTDAPGYRRLSAKDQEAIQLHLGQTLTNP